MMDAIYFVKQLRRMNEQGAPKNRFIYPCAGREMDSPEEVVAEVEEWAKEHSIKTRQSVFLEQWPNAVLDKSGVMLLCPTNVSTAHRDNNGKCKNPEKLCTDCRREFWMQEVE